MDRIHLVRHAEAAGHESADPGLSDTGRGQARALAAALAGAPVSEVWHGPRRRAAETAEVLASRLAVPAVASDLLDDRTAVPSAARRGDYSEPRLAWLDTFPEDERDVDGVAMTAAWRELWTRPRAGDVVLVTHAFVVSWFVTQALGAAPATWIRFSAANAGLTVIGTDPDGVPVVECVNETGHLSREAAPGRR